MNVRSPRRNRLAIPGLIALLLLGALMALGIGQIALGEASSSRRSGLLAYQVRPQNARGTAFAAAQYFDMGDHGRAEQVAREALSYAPYEVVAIRTLGRTRNAVRPGSGDRLMLLAARLGWRDQPTQLWVIERAILAGAPQLAMERAEALVRMQQQRELVFSLLRALAADPGGRPVLVRSLAARPFWRQNFLSPNETAGLQQMQVLSRLLLDLRGTAAPPNAMEARYAIDGLSAGGAYGEALALHRALFPNLHAGGALVSDPGFERTDSDYRAGSTASLFDWRLFATGGSSAALETGEGGRWLSAIASGGAARTAEQLLMLTPGRYRLSYRVRAADAAAGQQLRWQLRCREGDRLLFEAPSGPLPMQEWEERSHIFELAHGCPVQALALQAEPAGGMAESSAAFDDVTVRRAP